VSSVRHRALLARRVLYPPGMQQLTLTETRDWDRPSPHVARIARVDMAPDDEVAPVKGAIVGIPLSLFLWGLLGLALFAG
jgi:hypothetical protein